MPKGTASPGVIAIYASYVSGVLNADGASFLHDNASSTIPSVDHSGLVTVFSVILFKLQQFEVTQLEGTSSFDPPTLSVDYFAIIVHPPV